MKKLRAVGAISLAIMLVGCGNKEVLNIGKPLQYEGEEEVDFEKEITEAKTIDTVRELIQESEEIEAPETYNKDEAVFFSLDRPKEGVSEMRRYLYIQNDGSSVLKAEGQKGSDDFPDRYYALNEEQTTVLLNLLN